MANEMRDRLYDLLGECEKKYSAYYEEFIEQLDKAETQADFEKIYDGIIKKHDFFTDHLIENGVIVPPCKVGATLYFLYDKTFANRPDFKPYIYETNDWYFDIDQKGISILPRSIHSYKGKHHYYLGETVFLTKAEAEQKLKELSDDSWRSAVIRTFLGEGCL